LLWFALCQPRESFYYAFHRYLLGSHSLLGVIMKRSGLTFKLVKYLGLILGIGPTVLLVLLGMAEAVMFTFTGDTFNTGMTFDRGLVGFALFTFIGLVICWFAYVEDD
jgi:hypothetical protein